MWEFFLILSFDRLACLFVCKFASCRLNCKVETKSKIEFEPLSFRESSICVVSPLLFPFSLSPCPATIQLLLSVRRISSSCLQQRFTLEPRMWILNSNVMCGVVVKMVRHINITSVGEEWKGRGIERKGAKRGGEERNG